MAAATIVAALALAAIGGITLARWSAGQSFGGGTVTSGDLMLSGGTLTWEQTTPGVLDPPGGFLVSTPSDFTSMPGDVIEIVQPVATVLRGDNLAATLSVDFAGSGPPADVRDGAVEVSYYIATMAGEQIAPQTGRAEFGTTVPVPGMSGTDAGQVLVWHAVIEVRVLGDYVWTDGDLMNASRHWSIGDIEIRFDQVRAGAGFTSESEVP